MAGLTVSITSDTLTLTSGTKTVAGSAVGPNPIAQISYQILASGDNTITIPLGAAGVLFKPPANNTAILLIKGAGGDTGVRIAKICPTLITFDVVCPTLIINSAALHTANSEFNFF